MCRGLRRGVRAAPCQSKAAARPAQPQSGTTALRTQRHDGRAHGAREVLLVLRGTTRRLTVREVARLVCAGSQPTVNAALRRLAEEGLLHAEEAGNAYLYTLNRDHLAAPALEQLADIRSELERRLRAEIAAWEIAPTHVSIFGSAARGDGDTRSDIDVFVVRPERVAEDDPRWRTQLDRLSD